MPVSSASALSPGKKNVVSHPKVWAYPLFHSTAADFSHFPVALDVREHARACKLSQMELPSEWSCILQNEQHVVLNRSGV